MRLRTGLGSLLSALIVAAASGATAEADADDPAIAAFIAEAREADVVIIGEIHDNPSHHRVQAEVVAALQPDALVFEMIPQEMEARVNELRASGADSEAIAEALDWDQTGWPPFENYAPILEAAPQAQVFGAEQPTADVRRAMLEGAAGVFGPDAKIYGIDQPLSEAEQSAREALQAAAHCDMLPAEVLPGMVEAQRFRDAGLADATLWARIMTGEGQVVVITGSGHADKVRGMPALIAVADPETTVVSLGQFERGDAPEGEAYDAVLLADAPPREDPCRALAPEE